MSDYKHKKCSREGRQRIWASNGWWFGVIWMSFGNNGSIFPFHCHSSKCHVTVVLCGGQHRHAQSSHHHGQGPGSRVRPSVARGPPSCQLSGRRSYAIIWYHWYHRYMVERLPLKHCFWRIDCIGVCLLCNPRFVSNHVKAPELATLGAVWAWHQIYRTLVVQVRVSSGQRPTFWDIYRLGSTSCSGKLGYNLTKPHAPLDVLAKNLGLLSVTVAYWTVEPIFFASVRYNRYTTQTAKAPQSQVHFAVDSDSIFSERPVCTTGFRPGPERSKDMAIQMLDLWKSLSRICQDENERCIMCIGEYLK